MGEGDGDSSAAGVFSAAGDFSGAGVLFFLAGDGDDSAVVVFFAVVELEVALVPPVDFLAVVDVVVFFVAAVE